MSWLATPLRFPGSSGARCSCHPDQRPLTTLGGVEPQIRNGQDPAQWHRHPVGKVEVPKADDIKVIVERLNDEPIQVLVINAPDPLGGEVQLTAAQAGELGTLLLRAADLIQRGA